MDSFSHRLRAMSDIGTMYDASTLATLSDTMALKAVLEPMLIRASSKLMTTVMPIAYSGSAERGSTYMDIKGICQFPSVITV